MCQRAARRQGRALWGDRRTRHWGSSSMHWQEAFFTICLSKQGKTSEGVSALASSPIPTPSRQSGGATSIRGSHIGELCSPPSQGERSRHAEHSLTPVTAHAFHPMCESRHIAHRSHRGRAKNGIWHCPGRSKCSTRRRGVACLGLGNRMLRHIEMPLHCQSAVWRVQ